MNRRLVVARIFRPERFAVFRVRSSAPSNHG
jgi:hypothetical protein